jgi:hypothetical protein
MPPVVITLLTDFGTRDAYVGAMKGVILGINPPGALVDLTHEIPPQDLTAGAFVLAAAAPYFPPGTVHLAVVDPGIGTGRRGLAAFARGQYFVGPDNGLFHFIFKEADDLAIVSLENRAYFRAEISATFHGRDIFAPVAAHLARGVALEELGPPVTDPVLLSLPEPVFDEDEAAGELIYADRFGNLVSNLRFDRLLSWLGGQEFLVQVGPCTLTRFSTTYGEVAPGEVLALKGSHGYLEIACNLASAAERLGVSVGAPLRVRKV